jgi:hypothetical protein
MDGSYNLILQDLTVASFQFNPALCVVSSSRYSAGQYLDTLPNGSVCRNNILDKILATGGYFKRFRSCGNQKKKRDRPPELNHAGVRSGIPRQVR